MQHDKLKSKFVHSIGSKLVFLIAVLIIIISGFIFAFFPSKVEFLLIESLEERVQSIAKMTAYSVRAALDFGSKYDIENAFTVARQNKDIEFMVLKDAFGEVVYSYNMSKAENNTYDQLTDKEKIAADGNTFITKVTVAKEGREIGELYIGVSFVNLRREVFIIKTIIAAICFLIVIVGIFAAFFISKIVTIPIKKLVTVFNEIANGDLSKRAKIKSKDEVGILGATFNNMVDKLETAYTALEETNKSLQDEIVEREKIEQIVRKSEEKYRLLVDELPDLIIVHKDMKIQFINNVVTELLGYEPHEIINMNLFDLIANEYADKASERIRRRISGENVESYELELFTKSGEKLFFETRGTLVNDDNNPATLSVLTNITERKKFEQELQKANEELEQRVEERTAELKDAIGELENQIQVRKLAETSLRESEEKFKALAEYSSDGIMRFDRELRHLYVNKAHADTVNLPAAEFIGKTFVQLGFPDHLIELWNSSITKVFDTKEQYRIEFENMDQTWEDWSLCPEFDQNGEVKSVLASARDVTERKKTEHELIAAREKALEASRLKSEFLANMSHEIRTPLNGIIGMTNLLQHTEQSEEQLEFTHIIKSSGNVLLNIINDILDFSKIEAGRLELEIIDFNLRYVVEEAVEIFAQKAHEKKLELISFVNPEVPISLKGDPARLRQILINLIGNALKFTAHGEIVVSARLESISEEKLTVYFSVSDTGIGIDEQARERLFQPFTQADGSTTRKYGGTGLGLSISKRLVEMMNGIIGVESVVNKGSNFYFTAEFGVSEGESYHSSLPLENVTGIRVLIVDDNSTNRRILQYQTSSLKMDSDTAENASEAFEKMKNAAKENKPFQIAILDQLMPQINGLDLAKMIKADDAIRDTKLLMLTSFGELTKKVLKEYEISAYLNKPVKQSSLFDSIAGCLGESAFIEQSDMHEIFEGERKIPVVDHFNILIAEDNTTNQKVAFHMLKRLGFKHIDIVSNGIQAENSVAAKEYDIVFMDCQMPERDGFEATRNIRKNEVKRNVIIAMTANALHGDRERCISVGMDDYISKPINAKMLESTVKKWALIINKTKPHETVQVEEVQVAENKPIVKDEKTSTNTVSEEAELYVDVEQIEVLKGLGGDDETDLINQFIETYINDTPADLERLSEAVKSRDPKELKAAAHKVKGASGNIGAKVMQQLCFTLEMKGKNNDLTDIEKIFTEVVECFGKTKTALEEFLV